MRRAATVAAALAALAASAACGAAAHGTTTQASRLGGIRPSAGHTLAAISLDRDWLALAEDPATPGACPVVELVRLPGGERRPLTRPDGPTCRLGGRFWARPGARPLGNAIVKALWVVRSGSTAEAVKASTTEPEVVLARVGGIRAAAGPFLGPVVAKNWLRLFARYTVAPDGTEHGGEISGNRRELWRAVGPVAALGLDQEEHVVSVGGDGAIAGWHAHGARYGRVADAHAAAAAMDDGTVYVLRGDAPRLDVRRLDGTLERSWPVARGAEPLLDVSGATAVYLTRDTVHELDLETGRDRIAIRAPRGSRLLDAQIEPRFLVYALRGAPAGAGRVVVLRRRP